MVDAVVKRKYAIVRCPTIGSVSMIKVKNGGVVAVGETIMGVEVMKTLHSVVAPVSGEVQLLVKVGEMVSEGQMLAKVYVQSF